MVQMGNIIKNSYVLFPFQNSQLTFHSMNGSITIYFPLNEILLIITQYAKDTFEHQL